MQMPLRLETTILSGHRLEIIAPDFPDGAKVEVTVLALRKSSRPDADAERERSRTAAIDQFLALARASSFRSAGPYPKRDELNERH